MTPDRPRPEYGDPIGPEDEFFSPGMDELDPRPIAEALIRADPLFAELRDGEASILFLMRTSPELKSGKGTLGKMCLPVFSGALGKVGKWMLARLCDGIPDFVMVLDAGWWEQAAPDHRRALVHHELRHGMHAVESMGELRFDPEGKPLWAIRPHDIESFNSEVAEFGAWTPDLVSFTAALRQGGAV